MHRDRSIPDPGQETVTVEVSMDYPGWGISKNNIFRAGDRRKGMTTEARAWKASLAEFVRMSLLGTSARAHTLCLPVTVEVQATFTDRRRATDTQNFVELVDDAVEEATGINDRDYKTISYPPIYGGTPEVLVRVTVGLQGETAPPARPNVNRVVRSREPGGKRKDGNDRAGQ